MAYLAIIVIIFCTPVGSFTSDKIINQAGISVELGGQIFMSSEVISIPAVLSVGWVRTMFNNTSQNLTNKECVKRLNDIHQIINTQMSMSLRVNLGDLLSKNELTTYQKVLCEREPEFCNIYKITDINKPETRQKRFIFTTGAMVGAGLGAFGYWLYDKIAGSSASTAIETLKSHQQQIIRSIQTQGTSLLTLSKTTHQVWSIVVKTQEELTNLRSQMNCNDETLETLMRYIPLVSMIPNQFHRAINDLLSGRMTPDLVSYSQLKYLLRKTRALEGTLYHYDGSLFYQFSKTLPVEVDLERDLITFIIQIPKITLESTGTLFDIHNFGIHTINEVRRLRIPNHIVKFKMGDQTHLHLAVDKSKCENTPGIWLCGQYSMDYSYNQQCLDDIMSGVISNCIWEGRIDPTDPEVLVTKTFVFIHTCSKTTTLFNITLGGKKAMIHPPNCNKTLWFPLTYFDLLIVGIHHIDGHRTKIPTLIDMGEEVHSSINSGNPLKPFDNIWKSAPEITDMIENHINISRMILKSELDKTWDSSDSIDYKPYIGSTLISLSLGLMMFVWLKIQFRNLRRENLEDYARQVIDLHRMAQ